MKVLGIDWADVGKGALGLFQAGEVEAAPAAGH
jgi:hypothetical protein